MAAFQRQLQRNRDSRLHMFYISYSDVRLKRNEFLYFLSEDFGGKCKHTELALNFIQKQHFS